MMKDGPVPPPFEMMNTPIPKCSEPGCGEPTHIHPPNGHDEFCAHTFVPSIIRTFGMDRLPNGVTGFVVAARDTEGHRQMITICEDDSAKTRKAMLDHAVADLENAYRLPPPWASALMPASITHFFITAFKDEGAVRCTTVASDECDDVDEPWNGEYRLHP